MEAVEMRGYVWVAAVLGILWFMRGEHLRDDEGQPTAKPLSISWVCLTTSMFFFVELLLKLDDPFYRRHPESFYVLGFFIGFGVLSFVWMRFAHVTVSRGVVIERIPPFWRKEIPISELREVDTQGGAFVLRSDRRKISVMKGFMGAAGIVGEVKRLRPDLFKVDGSCGST
jgi:hypothetical protein